MEAEEAFTGILEQIQFSNLNFKMNLTPFSAITHLKRTVIKNQSGIPLTARSLSKLEEDNILEFENTSLTLKLQEVQFELENKNTDFTQMQIEREISENLKVQLKTKLEHTSKMVEEKNSEITLLKKSLKTQNYEVLKSKEDLRRSNKMLKEKDKSIYQLETKVENLYNNCKKFKAETSKLPA